MPGRRRGPDRRRPADRQRGHGPHSTSRSPGARSCGPASRSRWWSPRRPRPRPMRLPLVLVETTAPRTGPRPRPGDRARRAAGPARASAEEAGATGESQHAAVGGGAEEFTPDEPVSDNVVARSGYRRGDAAAALAESDVVVERPVRDQLGPPGLPRAAGRDGRARRRRRPPPDERDAGHVLHAVRGRQALRPVDGVRSGSPARRSAAGSVASDGHRPAGRGGDPRPAPARPRRADPATRTSG